VPQAHIEAAYDAYGWPQRMAASIEAATGKATKEHTQLQRKLKADSAALTADLDGFSRQVAAFAQLSDMAEQTEHAGQGAALMAALEGAAERAAAINGEEALFNVPKSEWPRVAQLQKELQPYLDLWVCIAGAAHVVPVEAPRSVAMHVRVYVVHM
jgi:hypothetical protein